MDKALENHFVADLSDEDFREFYEKLRKMKLTDKQIALALFYNTVGHPAYRSRVKAVEAVYKTDNNSSSTIASKHFSKPVMTKAVKEAKSFLKPVSYDDLWIRAEYIDLYEKAKESKNYEEARRILDLMSKTEDMYSTKSDKDSPQDERINDKVKKLEQKMETRFKREGLKVASGS